MVIRRKPRRRTENSIIRQPRKLSQNPNKNLQRILKQNSRKFKRQKRMAIKNLKTKTKNQPLKMRKKMLTKNQ